MTFTWTQDLTQTRDFVRFHCGDTIESESFLSDELIESLLLTHATPQAATIAALEYIVQRLAQPDTRIDTISLNAATALRTKQQLLREKRRQFGLASLNASAVHTYRADSAQTDPPDFSRGRSGNHQHEE